MSDCALKYRDVHSFSLSQITPKMDTQTIIKYEHPCASYDSYMSEKMSKSKYYNHESIVLDILTDICECILFNIKNNNCMHYHTCTKFTTTNSFKKAEYYLQTAPLLK